jgi:hypothetical protein
MNPVDRATNDALQQARGFPGSAVASAIRELDRQYRIMRQAASTQNAFTEATEGIARVTAAAERSPRSQEHLAGVDAALQQFRDAAARHNALLGPAAALEDVKRGVELWRSTEAVKQARGLDSLTAAFFRSQEQVRQTTRAAGMDLLADQLAALARGASRSTGTPLVPSPQWQQVIDAIRAAQRAEPAERLAQELAAAHPGRTQAEATAALLETVVEQTAEESGLDQDEADRIVGFGLDAMATMDTGVLAAAETGSQGVLGLLQRLVEELALKGVPLSPGALQVILALLFWLIPNPYTIVHDRRNDRVQAERHDSLIKTIPQRASEPLQYRATKRAIIRELPGQKARVLTRLEPGRLVMQREREGRWLHVDVVDPRSDEPGTGWVFEGNLCLLPTSERPGRSHQQ